MASRKPARPKATRSLPHKKGGKKPTGKKKEQKTRKPTPASSAPARQAVAAEEHEAFATARAAADAALGKKAENVVILDVRGLTTYADFFVVASGASDRQVSAISDAIDDSMKERGQRPLGVEGYSQGHWVLLDFGDIICHVFHDEARAFYDIEGLWADARRIPVEDAPRA